MPDSQPHLDHLAGCRGLSRRGRARPGDGASSCAPRWPSASAIATPSPEAPGSSILARAQAPSRGPLRRFRGLVAGLIGAPRAATRIAGSGLALVLALNPEIVPIDAFRSPGPLGADARRARRCPQRPSSPSLVFAEEPRPRRVGLPVSSIPSRSPPRTRRTPALRPGGGRAPVIEQAIFELRIGLVAGASR